MKTDQELNKERMTIKISNINKSGEKIRIRIKIRNKISQQQQ